MKPVTPEYISSLVNFDSIVSNHSWSFKAESLEMRDLQVKGTAKICNLLSKHNMAILADEVGMGKTIQALSTCVALWNENPNARVLVIAPRDEVAKNWQKEYITFLNYHYRHNDNIVKAINSNEPIRDLLFCQNLYDLVKNIQIGYGRFFIAKTSSFSTLAIRKENTEGQLERINFKVNESLRRELEKGDDAVNVKLAGILKSELDSRADGKPYFDLIIIDEAHYFRNTDGGSLRVKTARKFFGIDELPLAKNVLLLSATPNHSSKEDIKNIISYFTKKYSDKPADIVLNELCIRSITLPKFETSG